MVHIIKELFTTKVGYKKLATTKLGWALAVLLSFPMVAYYKSFNVPFTVEFTNQEVQIISEGGKITVCRDVRYHRDASLIVRRNFVQSIDKESLDDIAGAVSPISRKKGFYPVCRDESLPYLVKEGYWFAETTVEYVGEYGIFKHTVQLENIPIIVVEDEENVE